MALGGKLGERFNPVSRNGRQDSYGKGGFRKFTKKKKKAKTKSPDAILANITNEEFAIYESDFLPVEEQLIEEATDKQSGNKAAEAALKDSLEGFDRQRKQFDRGLGRSGIETTGAQQAKLDKGFDRARTRGGVNAANLARRNQIQEDDETITDLVNAGQNLRGVSLQGLGAASNMQHAREQQGRANKAQASSNFMSNVGTGAGIGFSIGGPVGGAVGAGVGALVSLF